MTEQNLPPKAPVEANQVDTEQKINTHELNIPGDLGQDRALSKWAVLKSKGWKFWVGSLVALLLVATAVVAGLMGQSGLFQGATKMAIVAPPRTAETQFTNFGYTYHSEDLTGVEFSPLQKLTDTNGSTDYTFALKTIDATNADLDKLYTWNTALVMRDTYGNDKIFQLADMGETKEVINLESEISEYEQAYIVKYTPPCTEGNCKVSLEAYASAPVYIKNQELFSLNILTSDGEGLSNPEYIYDFSKDLDLTVNPIKPLQDDTELQNSFANIFEAKHWLVATNVADVTTPLTMKVSPEEMLGTFTLDQASKDELESYVEGYESSEYKFGLTYSFQTTRTATAITPEDWGQESPSAFTVPMSEREGFLRAGSLEPVCPTDLVKMLNKLQTHIENEDEESYNNLVAQIETTSADIGLTNENFLALCGKIPEYVVAATACDNFTANATLSTDVFAGNSQEVKFTESGDSHEEIKIQFVNPTQVPAGASINDYYSLWDGDTRLSLVSGQTYYTYTAIDDSIKHFTVKVESAESIDLSSTKIQFGLMSDDACPTLAEDVGFNVIMTEETPSCEEYGTNTTLDLVVASSNIPAEITENGVYRNRYTYSDANDPRQAVKIELVMEDGSLIPPEKYTLYFHNTATVNDLDFFTDGQKQDTNTLSTEVSEANSIGVEVNLEDGDDFSGAKLQITYLEHEAPPVVCPLESADIATLRNDTPPEEPSTSACESIELTAPTLEEAYLTNPETPYALNFIVTNNKDTEASFTASLAEAADNVSLVDPSTLTIAAGASGTFTVHYSPTVPSNTLDKLKFRLNVEGEACEELEKDLLIKAVDPEEDPVDPGETCPEAETTAITDAFEGLAPADTTYQSDYATAINEIVDKLDSIEDIEELDENCSLPSEPAACTTEQQAAMDDIFEAAELDDPNAADYEDNFSAYLADVADYPADCEREIMITCTEAEQLYVNTQFAELDPNSEDIDTAYNALVEMFTDHETYATCTIPTKEEATSGVAPEDMITPEAHPVAEEQQNLVVENTPGGVIPGGNYPVGTVTDTRPSAPVYGSASVGQSGSIQGSTGPGLLVYPALMGLAGLIARRKEEQ